MKTKTQYPIQTIYGETIKRVRICTCGFPAYTGERHPECIRAAARERRLQLKYEAGFGFNRANVPQESAVCG